MPNAGNFRLSVIGKSLLRRLQNTILLYSIHLCLMFQCYRALWQWLYTLRDYSTSNTRQPWPGLNITIPAPLSVAMHASSPHIQVDPLDIEGKSVEECIQLALDAIAVNGFKPNASGKWQFPFGQLLMLSKAFGAFINIYVLLKFPKVTKSSYK